MHNRHSLLCLPIVILALTLATSIAGEPEGQQKSTVSDLLLEDNLNRQRFLATYATTTFTVITAKTSTVFFSCLSGTAATVCQGRTGKRFRRPTRNAPLELEKTDDLTTLDSSHEADDQVNIPVEKPLRVADSDKKAKFGITIWTTTKTTSSITVFYTNSASTLRLSYYCLAGGISLPATPCSG